MAIRQEVFRLSEKENYLAYVRNTYGEDAKIVKVTQVVGRTPNSAAILEIIVAVDDEVSKPSKINKQAAKAYNQEEIIRANKPIELDELKEDISKYFGIKPLKQTSQAHKQILNVKKDKSKDDRQLLNELNSKVEYLMSMRWGELAPARDNLDIPPEFAEIYNKAKNSDMLTSHLNEIMLVTLKNMPKPLLANKDAINRYFSTLLKNMIPCRIDAPIRKQKIIMLVGPTGVGKTTTLAKLAYRYAYGTRRYNTAIISLDNFRLGAKEQLAEYARSMRLPINFVKDENDLKKSLEALKGYEVVLIDSTGNSQYDKQKIEKLESFLNVSESEIEVNLVLNAGMKYDDMQQTYEAFNTLKIETLIFTKFDETKAFGNIFSLVFNVKKPVSFFSIGQNVPEDILVANSEYLIKCVLDGFKG